MKLKLAIFIILLAFAYSFSAAQAVTIAPTTTPTPTIMPLSTGTVSPTPSAMPTTELTVTPTEAVEGVATTVTQVSQEPKTEKDQPQFGIKEMVFLGLITLLLAIIILQAVLGKGRKEGEGSSESPKQEDQEE